MENNTGGKMKYEVEEKVLQATINYLAEQKYKEVMQLLQALQQSKQVKEDEQIKKTK